jgi:hypothetical protein
LIDELGFHIKTENIYGKKTLRFEDILGAGGGSVARKVKFEIKMLY